MVFVTELEKGRHYRKLRRDEKQFLASKEHRGFKYVLLQEVEMECVNKGKLARVRMAKGFISDGCSGPGLDAWDASGWYLHDWLYATHETVSGPISKTDADDVLLPHRDWAVTLFGARSWESSFERGALLLSRNNDGGLSIRRYQTHQRSQL